jgi:hypothetical protein
MRQRLFTALAAGSALAVAYHIAGAAGLLGSDATPVLRHLLFVGIDSVGVWYLLKRPIVLLPVFIALCVQQAQSHGGRALRWWTLDGRVDVISLVTLLGLAIALVALVLDARDRSPVVRRLVCPFPPNAAT